MPALMPEFLMRPVEPVDLKGFGQFLREQDLGYPNYNNWVDNRCLPELDAGYKIAYSVSSNRAMVAGIVFQKHKGLVGTLEIKNLRVRNDLRRRDIARFLVKQAQVFALQERYSRMIADFRAGREYSPALSRFLKSCGFEVLFQAELYPGGTDYIVAKKLKPSLLLS
jgi:ribosomal protein S18 acetylase RimI-like enzyme